MSPASSPVLPNPQRDVHALEKFFKDKLTPLFTGEPCTEETLLQIHHTVEEMCRSLPSPSDTMLVEYSEATCWDAGQLRAMGMEVPDSIPDCAWVPKHSMQITPAGCKVGHDPCEVIETFNITFTQPFRWVKLTCDGIEQPLEGGKESESADAREDEDDGDGAPTGGLSS